MNHFAIWQKLTPYCKATILQFKKKKTPPLNWLKNNVLKIFRLSTYNFFFTSCNEVKSLSHV